MNCFHWLTCRMKRLLSFLLFVMTGLLSRGLFVNVWRLGGMWTGRGAAGCYLCRRLSLPWQRRDPLVAGAVAHCVEIREIPTIHSTQRKWPNLTWPNLGGFSEAEWGQSRAGQTEPDWAGAHLSVSALTGASCAFACLFQFLSSFY